MISEYKDQIESTDYWDAKVLDFSISFMGDEANLYYEKDSESVWRVSFRQCARVEYDTDAAWKSRSSENLRYVKNMKEPQLGYYCQDISIEESKECDGFYDVSFDLSIMKGTITCKELVIEELPGSSCEFFWKSNK